MIALWKHECARVISKIEDYRWFYKTIEHVTEEELGVKYQPMIKERRMVC